jgi:hypothetical protein
VVPVGLEVLQVIPADLDLGDSSWPDELCRH